MGLLKRATDSIGVRNIAGLKHYLKASGFMGMCRACAFYEEVLLRMLLLETQALKSRCL